MDNNGLIDVYCIILYSTVAYSSHSQLFALMQVSLAFFAFCLCQALEAKIEDLKVAQVISNR